MKEQTTNSMIVAGVMSGTSADGINVALVRIRPPHTFKLLGHSEFPYPRKVRAAILAAMNSSSARVADLARLSFLLGELYSETIRATERKFRTKAHLIGCHGQTLYHQGEPQKFLGRSLSATWQTGEGAIVAARTGIPVVSDFRPADLAAGGKGAPLVPFLDFLLFRDARVGRIVQNIGGIANLTAIPANAEARHLIAFDTGPGNMVIDAVTRELYGKPFDRDGKIASAGVLHEEVIKKILRQDFFQQRPPKTAGREEFGREFVQDFLASCRAMRRQDVVATATALTARSIADAVERFVILPNRSCRASFQELILSGGGAQNRTLVAMLASALTLCGIRLRSSDELGLPSEAKEAAAFALLAYQTWHRRPSTVPSATGAKRAAILGKISYP
jgi:anhydro-N-acetylmuramic acid kinase